MKDISRPLPTIHAFSSLNARKQADLLVVPFWKVKEKNKVCGATDIKSLTSFLKPLLMTEDFKAKEGEVSILYTAGEKEPRIALLGLGEEDHITVEKLRRSFSSLTKACREKAQSLNIIMPQVSAIEKKAILRGITEGLLLPNYVFNQLKKETQKEKTQLISEINFIGVSPTELAVAKKYATIIQGVNIARDLANSNADDITPQYLSQLALTCSKELPRVKTTVFNKKRIEQEGMGLLLAVNRGSHRDPAFIIMEYTGNARSKERTVFVGKGITYDTGGLNIKLTGMEYMKSDMAGAAACFGALHAVANLGMKTNFTVLIPTTENAIGPNSYKPGDVYTGYGGKSVEIGNTDAEGRLVLADALAYAKENLQPTRIIDIATLTGAMEIILGTEAIGMMSNHDALADALLRAGSETFERLWRLPLFEEYKEQLKSDIADLKNIGGRPASSITAAVFLQQFVGDIPWAHCDIAAVDYLNEAKRYTPKHATGVGVRFLVEFLESL